MGLTFKCISSFRRNENLIWSENLKNVPGRSTQLFFFLVESLQFPFLEILSPFHSFINIYNLFHFVSLGNVSPLTHRHAFVWSCFLLMVAMFFKLQTSLNYIHATLMSFPVKKWVYRYSFANRFREVPILMHM